MTIIDRFLIWRFIDTFSTPPLPLYNHPVCKTSYRAVVCALSSIRYSQRIDWNFMLGITIRTRFNRFYVNLIKQLFIVAEWCTADRITQVTTSRWFMRETNAHQVADSPSFPILHGLQTNSSLHMNNTFLNITWLQQSPMSNIPEFKTSISIIL